MAFFQPDKLPNLIFCIGWSSIISEKIVKEKYIVGVHPSDLPNFVSAQRYLHHQLWRLGNENRLLSDVGIQRHG